MRSVIAGNLFAYRIAQAVALAIALTGGSSPTPAGEMRMRPAEAQRQTYEAFVSAATAGALDGRPSTCMSATR